MQKGTVVFLVLIICSALTMGATLGLITNREYLILHLTKLGNSKAAASPVDLGKSRAVAVAETIPTTSGIKTPSVSTPYSYNQEVNASTSQDAFSQAQLLLLTENEVKEICSMLKELGYETSDLSGAVKHFQEKNHLPATGYLDTDTLNSIITQVLKQKVTNLAP